MTEFETMPLWQVINLSRRVAIQQGDDYILFEADKVEASLHRLEHAYKTLPAYQRPTD